MSPKFTKQNFALGLFLRLFESIWKASLDLQVQRTECTRPGKACTLHAHLAPPKVKGARAAPCDAKDVAMKNYQEQFKSRVGIIAFYPEPQKGAQLCKTCIVGNNCLVCSALSINI